MNATAEHVGRGLELASALAPFVVPLGVLRDDAHGHWSRAAQGTGTFVDTGEARFILTADHVVREWLDVSGRGIAVGLRNRGSVDVTEWPTFRNERMDVASILVPSDFDVSEQLGKAFTALRWPIAQLVEGEHLVFVGAPGDLLDDDGRCLDLMALFGTVSECGQTPQFWMRHDYEDDTPRTLVVPRGLERVRLGGMSGAGIFSVERDGFSLRAVMREGHHIGLAAQRDGEESSAVQSEADAATATVVGVQLHELLNPDGSFSAVWS